MIIAKFITMPTHAPAHAVEVLENLEDNSFLVYIVGYRLSTGEEVSRVNSLAEALKNASHEVNEILIGNYDPLKL